MKTYMANPDKIERKWYVVDAEGCTLGRLASEVAKVLRGKNKPEYTPHIDTGDYVIVVNAAKVKVTGKKLQQKIYYNHSDYVGGMRETTLAEMMAKKPEKVIELAVKGMLPKGPMGSFLIMSLPIGPFGSIPLTASSTTFSGFFAIISASVVSLMPPTYSE